jgi:hypothetical protein
MEAASSTAESRVGKTPWRAKARAPSALASVNVAGSATGMEARTAVKTKGMISLAGIAWARAYATRMIIRMPLNTARLRTTRNTAFCCELTTWAVRTNSAVRPNLVRVPVAVTRDRLAAAHQRPGKSLEPRTRFSADGLTGEHGLIEQNIPLDQLHVRGNDATE